jgi:cathepsin L
MRLVLSLPLAATAAILPGERDFSAYSWEDYKLEFSKKGDDRKTVFEENLRMIKAHNAQEDKEWHAGVNKFTDMTREEFGKFVKGVKSEINFGGERHTFEVDSADIPDSIDWRDHEGIVTDVKDQGSCGSCWAFSAAETFESHLALATGTPATKLSAQQIVSCSPNPQHCGGTGGCDGSTQPLAFDYLQTAGLTTEADYPYTQRTGTCEQSKIKPVGWNTGYTVLQSNNYTELVTAVGTKGPIAVSIAASGFAFQFYSGGVMSKCNDYVMDHAVQLVGYGTDDGNDYWLVRNSWGEWGEGGYIRMKRYGEGQEPCGIDKSPQDGDACSGDTAPRTYCGECGILSASSYPTGMTTTAPPPGPAPPPPPTPPPAPTPPVPVPPPPGPSTMGCAFAFTQETCESSVDIKDPDGKLCLWCYLSGLGIGECVTNAEGLEGCNGEATLV